MKCDLHCHSHYSFDSTQPVEDLIRRAKEAGISVLAITDHNLISGSLEALKQNEVEIIPGIEIDCFCKDTIIHLTAYGMDLTDPRFTEWKEYYISELDRIGVLRLKLIEEKYNCKLNVDKIKSYTHFGYPYTNVEIEKVLFEDCDHPDLLPYQIGDKSQNPIANFYWDHLAIGKWGYVEMVLPNYIDIINWIHEIKGVIICAHPKVTIGKDMDTIQTLIDAGIDGFEVYCSYHDEEYANFYKEIVQKYGLLMTCGSDYHGATKPNIELGQTGYNEDCTQIVTMLKEKIKEKHNQ